MTLSTRLRRYAVAAVAITLTACGGGGGGGTEPAPPSTSSPGLATVQGGELLAYVKQRLQARGPLGGTPPGAADGAAWLTVATTATGVATVGGTVVQEAGVDEDDLIKTDGQRIYTLQPVHADGRTGTAFAQLDIHALDARGRPQRAGSASLATDTPSWVMTRGLQLAESAPRLAVLAESSGDLVSPPDCPPDMACITALLPYRPQAPRVLVQLLDAAQPAALPKPTRWEIDGRLVGSRRVGDRLVLVTLHTPTLAFDRLPVTATEAERRAALDRLGTAELLPTIRVDGGAPQPLVADTDCWLQKDNPSTQVALTTITVVDLASPGWTRSSRCFAGGSEAIYMASASLYLATSRSAVQTLQGRLSFAPETRTDIHKFTLDGARIAYRGSGSVAGHLGWDREKTPYRLSEHRGDLRVLSFTGSLGWASEADRATVAPSPATLTVLRERASDGTLQTLATLPNARRTAAIGKPGEQVYAVRFAGDRGYVVTFRQIDPLVVLDLADPADPRIAGELELPGFSNWLFPLDDGLMFGVGQDASAQGRLLGVKVALFDVRDAAAPRLLDSRRFGDSGSSTSLDVSAHGLTLQAVGDTTRLALAMALMQPNSASPQQRLQGFEVDRRTRTLALKPPIDLGSGWADLGSTRSLLLGNQLHHLRDGRLQTWDW